MTDNEKEIEAILINQEEIIEKLNQILNAKFLSAEEKGSVVGSARQTEKKDLEGEKVERKGKVGVETQREHAKGPSPSKLGDDSKPSKLKITEQTDSKMVINHEGRVYRKFEPCKYKCGMWSSWADDYKKGDHKLHVNPVTKEVLGGCPKYE